MKLRGINECLHYKHLSCYITVHSVGGTEDVCKCRLCEKEAEAEGREEKRVVRG
jgi:hypothetical protein